MRKVWTMIIVTTLLAALNATGEGIHQYVGVDKCKMCHKSESSGNQYGIWLESKHAKAFETLQSDAALAIAEKKGLKSVPSEAPECLKCHITGFGSDPTQFAESFDKTQGVQCESCHGPGSDYKKKSIMENREEAIANGLNPILVADGSAEKWCVKCHNEESPNYKEFKFQEFWNKIKHPVPSKSP